MIDGQRYNMAWGEGSPRARSFARYGVKEGVSRADIEEGSYNLVPCVGGLRPCVERTSLNVAMTLANVGAANLAEYRQMCMIEGP
jgi:hypothetical protein